MMSISSRIRAILHPITRKGVGHWLRMLLLLAGGYYAGHLLSKGEWLTQLRYDIYARQLKLQHRGILYPQRTAIVLIGDEDYWSARFEARKPLKRDQLAELLDRLTQAGANTVIIDIDLRSPVPDQPAYEFPTYAPEDAKLLAAVDRMCKAGGHVVRIWIGLKDVLALDVDAFERSVDCGIQHVGNAQARLLVERHAPILLEQLTRCVVRNVPVPR